MRHEPELPMPILSARKGTKTRPGGCRANTKKGVSMKQEQGNPAELKHDFWKAMTDSPFVMLQLDTDADSAAPMTAQLDKDANHEIWFFTSRGNHFAKLGPATFTFASKDHAVFARVHGLLSIETSRERLDKHWSSQVQAWFPGGKDDPDLVMLSMKLGEASIWVASKMGVLGTARLMLGLDMRDKAQHTHVETRL